MCNPRQLLIEAAHLTNQMGSSTCVITSIDKEAPLLYTANLGDSGYLLLRRNGSELTTVYRSKEQTHGFNFPYQIGTGGDDPERAELKVHEVAHNDILVVGTDGLFDNMYDEKIKQLIEPHLNERRDDLMEDPKAVANVIADEAEKLSNIPNYLSPFAKAAKQYNYEFMGGKQDDITVAVAQIKLHPIQQ